TAASFLAVAAAFQLVDGLQAVAAGALRGYKDTAIPMVIQVIGYWGIGAGAMAALGFFTPLAGIGVWTGMALGLAAVAVALIWRFHRLSRRPPGAFAALGEAV
ncbi:MAG: MATE family efflux transporter, partial [Pseudomonadota bacterium]|nr:MATE family efflux transporter [Pseudomonadota bacterium]